jgi:hypothetical protein
MTRRLELTESVFKSFQAENAHIDLAFAVMTCSASASPIAADCTNPWHPAPVSYDSTGAVLNRGSFPGCSQA